MTSVNRDAEVFTPNDAKDKGVRRVMLETDELRKRTWPYAVNFNGGYTAASDYCRPVATMSLLLHH